LVKDFSPRSQILKPPTAFIELVVTLQPETVDLPTISEEATFTASQYALADYTMGEELSYTMSDCIDMASISPNESQQC
jgi:hypothetical protein